MNKQKCTKELYCQFLLAAQTNFTGTEMASHLPTVEHDAITRWLAQTRLTAANLWEQVEPLVVPEQGVLIIDDSLIEKPKSTHDPLVTWQYSGASHQIVRGIGLVTLLWSQQDEHIPLDYRIYAKAQDGYTKNQHVQEMLRLAHHRGLHPTAVLFDSWYASQENLALIQLFGWVWVTQLKKNRVVNYTHHLEDLDIPSQGTVVNLKFVGPVKVFKVTARDGDIEYWATNELGHTPQDISDAAAQRWKIEEYHRGLKQLTGIARCQARTPRSQRTHIFCAIMVFVSLEKLRLERAITWYQAKRQIIQEALTTYLHAPTIPLAFVATA